MKRILFLLSVLCLSTIMGHAQSATPRLWRSASPAFTTEAQLRSLAKRYENNSRMSYYLILRAFNQGQSMTKSVVLTYHDLYEANTSNVRVQAAFAFAHYIATDYDLEGAPLQDRQLQSLSWLALNLRRRTVQSLPKDPTILLMAARSTYFLNKVGIKENLPDMERGIDWAKQSTQLDSNWVDSQYWLAKMLQYFAMNHPVTATEITDDSIHRQSIAPALRALRLGTQARDRTTQIGCWGMLAKAYSPHQKQLALTYLDKYIAALPPVIKERQREVLTVWRRSLVKDIKKAQKQE